MAEALKIKSRGAGEVRKKHLDFPELKNIGYLGNISCFHEANISECSGFDTQGDFYAREKTLHYTSSILVAVHI